MALVHSSIVILDKLHRYHNLEHHVHLYTKGYLRPQLNKRTKETNTKNERLEEKISKRKPWA